MIKKLVFVSLLCGVIVSSKAYAQAFDGSDDRKIFLGPTMVGDKSGIELQVDDGLSDLVSTGGKLIFLFIKDAENLDEFDRTASAFSKFDLALFLRFHFSEALKLSEKTDPYLGLDLSLKAIGAHIGFKYNFSETLGIYAQAGHAFSGSFWSATPDNSDSDFIVNRFAKRTNISLGLTFSIQSGSYGRY
ncbi:MAG: hypothetical protein IPN08_02425 [Bacteroidales bacterium]|nr:hypothetical protein [Bacteroidales bacterium]MBK9356238.1 hypothetical protein [Bacteroidales bacterium]